MGEVLRTRRRVFSPQKPESSPTEKQLLSWLKATDIEMGPVDSSIACLVFIFATGWRLRWETSYQTYDRIGMPMNRKHGCMIIHSSLR